MITVWPSVFCYIGLCSGKFLCPSDTRGQNGATVSEDFIAFICRKRCSSVSRKSMNRSERLFRQLDRRSYVFGRLLKRYQSRLAISFDLSLYSSLSVGSRIFACFWIANESEMNSSYWFNPLETVLLCVCLIFRCLVSFSRFSNSDICKSLRGKDSILALDT